MERRERVTNIERRENVNNQKGLKNISGVIQVWGKSLLI
jgi:hypothetical protein